MGSINLLIVCVCDGGHHGGGHHSFIHSYEKEEEDDVAFPSLYPCASLLYSILYVVM